jgi:hypothetical protein
MSPPPTLKGGIMAKTNTAEETTDREWEEFKRQVRSVTIVLGSLLFAPVIILIGVGYGIRAGLIAGTEKTLELLKGWEV